MLAHMIILVLQLKSERKGLPKAPNALNGRGSNQSQGNPKPLYHTSSD